MKCFVVRDLLPNHIEGLNSKETCAEIEQHLKTCRECRTVYEKMRTPLPIDEKPEYETVEFAKTFKKIKAKIYKGRMQAAFITLILLICLILFAQLYRISVPYDSSIMKVEPYQAVAVRSRDGSCYWESLDNLDFETAKLVLSGDYKVFNQVQFAHREKKYSLDIEAYGRTIRRGGEAVKVIYFCYTKTLWNHLFPHGEQNYYSYSRPAIVYGPDCPIEDYQPRPCEIYYLQAENIEKLYKLSDEEFDAQREQAIFVWGGEI